MIYPHAARLPARVGACMLWEMDVSIISGQLALLHVKLEPGDGFEVYGGTSEDGLRVERQSDSEWLVTMDEQDVAGRPLVRYNLYARQVASGREWAILGGKILVSQRTATVPGDKLAPVEYFVTVPVLENAVDLTGTALVTGIVGPRGYSAYEVAVLEGFVGSEAEWLESIRQQTATLAVKQVTPLMERAETAADKSERESAAAKTEQETAAAHAKAAKESELAASGHATAAAGEVTKAAAEVEKAKQERETAAGHQTAAAKSAQDAETAKTGAEQAARDAQTAKSGAEQAAANADASKSAAQNAESNAKASADSAAADKAAAAQAKLDAQAAQSTAEEKASIATKAAEDAQSPESIAAQAARPATMVLVKDELLALLGNASLFDVDTDGQKIIVHTDRLSDEQLTAVTDMLERFVLPFIVVELYNHNMEISWRALGKYSECTSVEDMLAVNEDYQNDLTSDGEWVYPLPKLEKMHTVDESGNAEKGIFQDNPKIKKWLVDLPSVTHMGKAFQNSSIEEFRGACPSLKATTLLYYANKMTNETGFVFHGSNLRIFKSDWSNVRQFNYYTFGFLEWLETFDTELTDLCSGSNAFSGSKLKKEIIINILNSLSDAEYLKTLHSGAEMKLNIGVDVNYQGDEAVRAAMEAAAAQGWTITPQWNGTSTAATYSLRPAPPLPVYAKVDTYPGEDGNDIRLLTWCHEVISPTGKEPEELGYTLFESVKAAREYFGLPDETLTNE